MSETNEAATVARLLDVSLRQCPTTDERAAMRSGMGDAAALCDVLERIVLEVNLDYRGKPTKRGRELAAVAKRCGDAIWQMREQVSVPPLPFARRPTDIIGGLKR